MLFSQKPTLLRRVSCGVVIESPQGWLMVRATKRDRWDFPKGGMEDHETPLQAALRECHEETGLDWTAQAGEFEDLGRHPYLPNKDLHLFRLRVNESFDLHRCSCSTYARYGDGPPHPEIDAWAWMAPEQARIFVGKGLRALIDHLDLGRFYGARPASWPRQNGFTTPTPTE